MEDSRTPINASEEAALDYLEQYVDATGDDEHVTREAAVTHLVEQGMERAGLRS